MAIPTGIVSNPVTVTIAGAPAITISATPTSEPSSGGVVVVSGTVQNIPDGTPVNLLVNGTADPNTPPATVTGGAFSFNWTAPANTTPTAITDTLTVST